VVEQDDAVVDLEIRGDEAPHALITPETVREEDRPPSGHTAHPHPVALEDVHH
jgi:hypothetical protein